MKSLWIASAVVVVILFCATPASFWEFDELLFAQALHRYDPIAHHPPPPGYPVFIFVARVFRFVTPSDFAALTAVSFVASAIGFVLLALAFGRMTDPTTGIIAALLFYLSPAMLVHSTLPISDPGAIALVAAALYFAPVSPGWFAFFAALAVGWRPQFCFFIVPLLFATLPNVRRASARLLLIFTVVCLAWLVPLTLAVGGVEHLIRFESSQAKYLAEHDAATSRSAWTPAAMLVHFISHPWGPRIMALPLLGLAAVGAWRLRTKRAVWPIAIAGTIYLAVALTIMDPADGVRYAIPFVLLTSLLAAAGVTAMSGRPYILAGIFAAGSIIYVSSFTVQRSTSASPPVRAALFGIPHKAALGYELSLWPHATYLFAGHPLFRIDASLQQLFDQPGVPLYAYADGIGYAPNSRVFAWETSDAYWNLTRNHYRVVSLTPIGPERRFRVVRGVYVLERERAAESWRWLDDDAVIETPRATGVDLRLALPAIYPYPDNTVKVTVDGKPIGEIYLRPGEVRRFVAGFPAPARILELKSARSFTPPHDPRHLAVELYDLSFRGVAAAKRPNG